ncbi:helix-turn-helix domain-containing protein [Desulfosporosinus shakirovi]|uniref:helix-turn-helix domain-containing protein n=1 Tax=Desulfosporosinus shakirovi TaxID=2885154 RepID=UPI001E600BFF|nr:helix-turn-helix domain-containing protein [Desulfosporosinus sp. SRJS8]MCB8816155.1 helix-turn-helix domain-containing protein [Desulfosporosinus sp. SRJS8]
MIGKLLTELRNKRGLTQDQIADALEVKRPRYNSWENDIAKPDIQMLKKIAAFHNVTPDYLLSFETNTISPSWATPKDRRDFKKMLEDDGDLMFDGVPIDKEDRKRVMDVLTGLFWEAKHMNKRKNKPSSTYGTKK